MLIYKLFIYLFLSLNIIACNSNFNESNPILIEQGLWFKEISSNKSNYFPKSSVEFSLLFKGTPKENSKILVRYRQLNKIIESQMFELRDSLYHKWIWVTPDMDYKGYLVEIFLIRNNKFLDQINIAVDVSSDWKKFPRYGFVSRYEPFSKNTIDSVMTKLNRHHINGIQFYDWHYKHHMPLSINNGDVTDTWIDIAKRTIHRKTIEQYLSATKKYGMKSMAYNLLYGSWEDGSIDGVSTDWRLYSDSSLQKAVKIDFDDNWSSDIYWMNPANKNWQQYIYKQTEKVFANLPFDGWHVDQLGDWGKMWTSEALKISPDTTFGQFLDNAAKYLKRPLVMNAVLQYGQSQIADSPVEFLYSEVWDPDSTFADLQNIIKENDSLGANKLRTVVAAYVNQGIAERPGKANNAAILLTDALIFAMGGSHLELGEHLLIHPYFPNNNLAIDLDLEKSILNYYDFLVAYQNILRDNLNEVELNLTSNDKVIFSKIPEMNKILYLTKANDKRIVINLLNYKSVKTMNWRDNKSEQVEPETISNFQLEIETSEKVSSIWYASPDFDFTSPTSLEFTTDGNLVNVILPELKYWTTLVLEKE